MSISKDYSNQSVTLHFKLKHFSWSTIEYVLHQTGYSKLIEYEDICLNTDMFIHKIEISTGKIIPNDIKIDDNQFRVFTFGIDKLNDEARHYIMTNYIPMSKIEYELKYPERNKLYLCVPYKNEQSRLDCKLDTKELNLKGWSFIMNKRTKNSYILTPPKKIQMVKTGNVYWGDSSCSMYEWNCTPTTWSLPIEELHRPMYYNNNLGGWIISLRYRSQLLDAGVIEIE
jgi:hypothetical protein